MGHERLGFLPRTKQWQAIIDQLASYDDSREKTASIADATLKKISQTYKRMPDDESVIKAIKYLVTLSISAKTENQLLYLQQNNININHEISLFSLVRSAKQYITTEFGSLETNKIAQDSVLQALTSFAKSHIDHQISLIETESSNLWKNIGTGAAFCELSRSFFATFTDKYLKYYLEREAAHSINDYTAIVVFSNHLSEQTQTISHHAFDTAKLTQSFAAGWYNNHSKDRLPSEKEISSFLNIAFGKLREEFRREADRQ